jgi:membrane protein DedA with SNARE-associated domain/uncharacterized tellurite resistance protein B-like protein
MIALTTAVENIFPPTPSDLAVAVGAFLSHDGVTLPVTLFLVAWGSSVAGAVAVYAVSRRYGRAFFDGRIGRRLITPSGIVALERGYMRFGMAGIFFCRLLPGFRSVVAPFSGLMNLSPGRALAPMALGSAVWYGGLIYAATTVGNSWTRISDLLGQVNHTLGIAGLVAAGLLVLRWIMRRRKGTANARLWQAIHHAFRDDLAGERRAQSDPAAAAAATLFLELAQGDASVAPEEMRAIESGLRDRWGLATLDPDSSTSHESPRDHAEIANRVTSLYGHEQRLGLAERLWRITCAERTLTPRTDRLMQRAGQLLGLSAAELAEARRRVGA